MSFVKIKNVSKTFDHEGRTLSVLNEINLEISEGEFITLLGHSGAGKSTLLNILGTLDLPTQGEVFFEQRDITKMTPKELARFRNENVGFVFQFHHLLGEFTALENVMMPGLIHGSKRSELKSAAEKLLEEVGLKERMTHRPGELSGGEQQRVALARALIMQPRLVLADEPTGNLDTHTSEQIQELFFTLNQKSKTAFLVVTHSLELAKKAPRIIQMKDGMIASDVYQQLEPFQSNP